MALRLFQNSAEKERKNFLDKKNLFDHKKNLFEQQPQQKTFLKNEKRF